MFLMLKTAKSILLHTRDTSSQFWILSVRIKTRFVPFVKLPINPLLLAFNLLIFSTGCLLKTGFDFGLLISDIISWIFYWILGWILLWFNYFNFTSVMKFLITKLCNKFYYFKSPIDHEAIVYKTNHEIIFFFSITGIH